MVSKDFKASRALTEDDCDALLKLSEGEDPAKVYGLRLTECATVGDVEAATYLLDHGADINCQDEHGMTALHYAAAHGARPCIRLLTSFNDCSYLIQDNKGRYASELAYGCGKDYAVGLLLQKKQVRQAYAQGVPAWDKPRV